MSPPFVPPVWEGETCGMAVVCWGECAARPPPRREQSQMNS